MNKKAMGWGILFIGLMGILVVFVHDYLAGEPALTFGPKSYTFLIISIILVITGIVSLVKSGNQGA